MTVAREHGWLVADVPAEWIPAAKEERARRWGSVPDLFDTPRDARWRGVIGERAVASFLRRRGIRHEAHGGLADHRPDIEIDGRRVHVKTTGGEIRPSSVIRSPRRDLMKYRDTDDIFGMIVDGFGPMKVALVGAVTVAEFLLYSEERDGPYQPCFELRADRFVPPDDWIRRLP